MKSRLFFFSVFILGITGMTGCAFFNTYFNARKAFNNGMASVQRSWELKSTQRQPSRDITADRFDEIFINIPDDAKAFFSTAIEKGNKVVVLHSDSRWVEDAILLLGKAHFLRGTGNDYYDAKNRFEVLFVKYPNSRFSAEARLWYAKTLLQLNLTEQAYRILGEIASQPSDPDIQAEARLIIGEQFFRANRPAEALSEFIIADSLARRITLRRQACFKAAVLHYNQENYDAAYRYFRKMTKLELSAADQFDVTLMTARALKHREKFDEAIRLLDKLLGDQRHKNHFVTAEFEIADILMLQGKHKDAERQYKFVIDTYRIPQFSGDAYFRLGTLYDTVYQQPDTANRFYQIVKSKYSQSSFIAMAEERLIRLQRMEFFNKAIRREYELIRWIDEAITTPGMISDTASSGAVRTDVSNDSLDLDSTSDSSLSAQDSLSGSDSIVTMMDNVNLDSLEWLKNIETSDIDLGDKTSGKAESRSASGQKTNDTLKIKSVFENDFKEAVAENKELKDRLQFIKNEQTKLQGQHSVDSLIAYRPSVINRLAALYFELGDFFFYTAGHPDSALYYYSVVADSFSQTSSAEPSMYAISGVYEKINPPLYLPALKKAYQAYPDGKLTYIYKKIFPDPVEDSMTLLFENAESALAGSDFDKAIAVYRTIAGRDSGTDQARALFMMGSILEKTEQNEPAFRIYKTLLHGHPSHPLSEKIKNKVSQYAARQGIPEDSTIFFIDTQYVKVDFSEFRKVTTVIPKDTATLIKKTAQQSDTTSDDSSSVIKQSGKNDKDASDKDEGVLKNDSTEMKINKEAEKTDNSGLIDSTGTTSKKSDDE